MEKQKLTHIIESHKLWLSDSGGQRADLQRADLQGADLQRADLQGAYLQGAYCGELRVLQVGPIGSRGDTLLIKSGAVDEVMTGCFRGTLTEFRTALVRTYPDATNVYRRQYECVLGLLAIS